MIRPLLRIALGVALLCALGIDDAVGNDDLEFAINLLTLVPFTFEGRDRPYHVNELRNNLGFSHMAAALLAMEHFNERDPRVVPELADREFEKDMCPLFFSDLSLIADTRGRGSEAVAVALDQINNLATPNAIAGGYHEEPALELSVIASSLKIPYVAYGGSNVRVVTPYYYPYSSRTSAGVIEVAEAATSFLFHVGRTDAISILQAASTTSSQLAEGILASATKRGANVKVNTYVPPVFSGPERDVEDSVMRLRETGFRTFVLIVESIKDELKLIADAANKLGLTNGDYFWLIMGDIELDFFSSPEVTNDESIRNLLQGSGHVRAVDLFSWDPSKDKFLTSWMGQNVTFVQKVNAKNPLDPESPGYFFADDDYFQTALPMPGAGFLYDAIMSIGLGLCKAKANGDWSEWSIVASQQLTEFRGATGPVSFGSNPANPGGRAAGTLSFGAYNILPQVTKRIDTDSPGSNYVLSNILPMGNYSQWKDVVPFHFADGSRNPPALLQDPADQMYLSSWARILGFTLFGIAVLVIILSIIWVYVYRNTRVVKASQPEFLYAIDFGSLLIASCIPVNSFDEIYTDIATLNRLCTATPWLVFSGVMILYSALFTKLWRINKLLQFRRVRIRVSHVLWPFILLFAAAMVVMTVWTIVEGFEWATIQVSPTSEEMIGKCEGISSVAFFTPIFLLTVTPVLLTAAMAWKTRDVDSMYSESGWIALLIGVHLQVLVVAIPVLGILEGRSSNARYLGQVAVFFLYPMSTVGLIIGPKMAVQHSKPKMTSRRGSSITGQVHVSGLPNTAHLATSSPIVQQIGASCKNSTSSSSDYDNQGRRFSVESAVRTGDCTEPDGSVSMQQATDEFSGWCRDVAKDTTTVSDKELLIDGGETVHT